jgi:hypothetical protein
MVPLPSGYSPSPSAVRNSRSAPQTGPPLLVGQLGIRKGVALPGQPTATTAHRHRTSSKALVNLGQFGLQALQPALLGEPLGPAGIATHPALPLPNRDCQPPADRVGSTPQPDPTVQQIPICPLPLVARGPRDGPRPATRRAAGQGPLADRALVGRLAEPAAPGKIGAGQTAKVLANRPYHRLVGSRESQPGPDPSTSRSGDHERLLDRTHVW